MNAPLRHSPLCSECGRPLPSEAISRLAGLSLSPSQRIIATTLSGHIGEWVRTSVLVAALYGRRDDGGPLEPMQTVVVFVHRLAPKLAGVGLRIESQRGGPDGGSRRRMVMIDDE